MGMKDFLVHINVSSHCRSTIEVAARLTKAFDGRLVGLFTSARTDIPFYMMEETASDVEPTMRAWWLQARDKLKAEFDEVLAGTGASGSWMEVDDRDGSAVSRHARYADLTIVGQLDPDELLPRPEYRIPERVALEFGGPVVVVPHAGAFPTIGRRVLIAWNASAQSARAVRDALPVLRKAEGGDDTDSQSRQPGGNEVDRPGAQIAAYLAHHGVAAKARELVVDDVAAGEMILSQAADEGADLIVMGAYGHRPGARARPRRRDAHPAQADDGADPDVSLIQRRASAACAAAKTLTSPGTRKRKAFTAEPNPGDVGDHGDALPAREVFEPELEIVPGGSRFDAGEGRAELVVAADLALAAEHFLDLGDQHVFVVFPGHVPFGGEGDDAVGQTVHELDHDDPPRLKCLLDQGMTVMGIGERLTSLCETLPSSSPVTGPVPRLPTTISSIFFSCAISMIVGAGSPLRDSR